MKKFYAILCLAIASLTQLHAQAPQGFNYQATVRNNTGDLIVNTNVYFKFNVMQGSQTSLPVFTEIHYVPTDDLGQVNLVIGQGTATTGTFSALNWSLGNYYLGIELDTGNGYVAMGTTQLLSVPYALYAENSGNSTPTTPSLETVLAENNSANNQQIKDLQDPTEAQDAATKSYVDDSLLFSSEYEGISTNSSQYDLLPNHKYLLTSDNVTLYLNPGNLHDEIIVHVVQPRVFPYQVTILADYMWWMADGGDILFENSVSGYLKSGENKFIRIDDGWICGSFYTEVDDIDNDGDGYTENQGDCDDANAQVNPVATEIEDGIDNDCDGEIDEGFNESGTVIDQDGNTYDYLTYGDQVWTVENAEMVTYRDGTPIPQVTDPTVWSNLTTGAWAYYDNDPTKPRLYNWYAIKGIHDTDPNTPNKEFAPEGWHVPTDAEWTTLENYLIAIGYNYDGTTTGNKLAKSIASNTGWNSSTNEGVPGNDQSLNNSSGFNAFPEGNRYNYGPFTAAGGFAIFWTSTESSLDYAWFRMLYNSDIFIERNGGNFKKDGMSVRFVRD